MVRCVILRGFVGYVLCSGVFVRSVRVDFDRAVVVVCELDVRRVWEGSGRVRMIDRVLIMVGVWSGVFVVVIVILIWVVIGNIGVFAKWCSWISCSCFVWLVD